MGGGVDMEDILSQMFGMGGGGGMPGMGGGGPRRPQKGPDDEQKYPVTLEELYHGKSTKFAITKNVKCSHCKGRGGKENAKAKQCQSCKGRGTSSDSIPAGFEHGRVNMYAGEKTVLRQAGPFLQQVSMMCDVCQGGGSTFADKDKCKKCKGKKIASEKKMLELYIPPGSK